ncbi:MAG: RNA methyltransferase [Clostridiales bacterium]|nr:RNA methyltransferase [Clostridiales bacterium]
MTDQILSRSNPRIKEYARLCSSAAVRRERGLFVLEGARLCADAVKSGIAVSEAYVTAAAREKYSDAVGALCAAARKSYEITEEIAAKMSDTRQPQGVFCVCRTLDKWPGLDTIGRDGCFAALENVQDPSNLGAVFRTAEALGVSGLLLSEGCCDIYNPKVLRASMGAVFRLPVTVIKGSFAKTMRALGEKGFHTLAAVPDETAVPVTAMDSFGGTIMVIGNEGNGLTKETIEACACRVTIPMKGRAESLNAAMAAGILMWEMTRR